MYGLNRFEGKHMLSIKAETFDFRKFLPVFLLANLGKRVKCAEKEFFLDIYIVH